jgi:hypothetical protein
MGWCARFRIGETASVWATCRHASDRECGHDQATAFAPDGVLKALVVETVPECAGWDDSETRLFSPMVQGTLQKNESA